MTVEYKPYQKIPDTVKYGVWDLPPTILKRIEVQGKAQKDHATLCASFDAKLSDLPVDSDHMEERFALMDKMTKSGRPIKWKHGYFSARSKSRRKEITQLLRQSRELLRKVYET